MAEVLPLETVNRVPYAFFNTLHHSENLEDGAALENEYQNLTASLLSSETLDLETSFRALYTGYVDDIREYGSALQYKDFPAGYPVQANLSREFGVRDYKIGLLLNKPKPASDYLSNLSLLSADELYALTGTRELEKALPYFLSGDYYFSYMHTLFANLQFIQTISLATNKRKLTLFVKMFPKDFEDQIVIDALRKINITRVNFWSKKSGTVEFDLRKSPQDTHGFQIKVINPFPTPEPLTQALAYFSKPVVGTTGELSLFFVLSMGKLPLHEWLILQRFLNDEFARIAKENNLGLLHDYFRYFSPGKKAGALKRILKKPEDIKAFTNILASEYNASPFLRKLIRMTFNDNSQLWQAIGQIDEAIKQDSIHELPEKWQDIAWTRVIAKKIQALSQLPEVDEIAEASEEIEAFVENIKTPLLRKILSDIPDNISPYSLDLDDD